MPVDIRERAPEVERDLGLARWAGFSGARAQVVPDVLVVKDLVADVRVALGPDLFVEATDQSLCSLRYPFVDPRDM